MSFTKLIGNNWEDYELIDAGNNKKLERFGNVITIRPEVNAYFKSGLSEFEWYQKAHVEFISEGSQKGDWKKLKSFNEESWQITYQQIKCKLELTKFKHVGLFPEQNINWEFIFNHLDQSKRFLNLFAYTGAASLVAKSTGAEVVHVDSVKQLISWAKQNQDLSELDNVKWVHEDALKFIEREVKRENKYDGIIMDPPAWGIGAKGEKWKLEEKISSLIQNASQLLNPNGFFILNTYSPQLKIEHLKSFSNQFLEDGKSEIFELWMETKTGKNLYYGNGIKFIKS